MIANNPILDHFVDINKSIPRETKLEAGVVV